MLSLTRAVILAAEAHDGQVDKAGAPYILHPLRVMLQMDTDEERVVAALHDVLEDSHKPIDLTEFSTRVRSAVAVLSHEKGQPYPEYIDEVSKDALATKIKMADLRDNIQVGRLLQLPLGERARLVEKYIPALSKLSQAKKAEKVLP